jgi:YD repeat-containing protein
MRSRLATALVSLAAACAASVSTAQVTTTYTYDAQGQVKTVVRSNNTVAYTYDAAGNRTALNVVYPPPGAAAGSLSVPFGGSASLALPVSGQFTGATIDAAPAKGSVSISGTTATYTAGANSYGADSFTYHAVGPGGNSAVQTISISIANPPAPGANNGALNVAYNSAASLAAPATGVATGLVIDSNPAKGAVSTSGTTFTYTATWPNYGADSFTYHAVGPGGSSPTRTINVAIANGAAPTANNGSASTAYNAPVTITYPVGGDYGIAALDSQPAHGSVSPPTYVGGVGTQSTYTPTAGYYGADSWTFHGTSPFGNSPVRTFSITVGNPPAPTAANTSISTAYNTAGGVALPGSGVVSQYILVTNPGHGSAVISGGGVTYTPAAGYSGIDSFTYYANGPGGNSNVATVSVTVGNPPAPSVGAISTSTAFNTLKYITLSPSGVYSSLAIASSPAHGSVWISGTTAIYSPSPTYSGPDSFTYVANGPGGTSAPATVSVTVGAPPPNNPPTAVNDGTIQIVAGDTAYVNVVANDTDPDGDTLTVIAISKTTSTKADYSFSGGTITVMSKSSKGGDSLTYTISDGKGGTSTATLSINVTF